MTRKRDRFFALFGALLFLGTASALTIAVIVDGVTRKDDTTASTTDTTKSTTSDTSTDTKGKTMLQGTELKDFTPGAKITSLQMQDTTVGTGDAVKSGDTITADYTGALASTGVIFQSSLDSGQTFSTAIGQGQVIKGWDEGIIGMKVGGTRRLLIPADLAYGSQAQNGIPANSDLVFDITLHKIGS